MVSVCPVISKSSSPFITKSTNYNWYNSHFHVPQFFPFPSKVEVLLLFIFFQFYSVVSWDSKVRNSVSSLFCCCCCCWLLEGLVVWPTLSDSFVPQNLRGVCVSHFPEQMLGCAYTIYSYDQISIPCTVPNGSPCPPSRVWSYTLCVLICCICLLCDWSLSLHNLHLLFCCVLSILASLLLVLMALFCTAIRRDSVSLFILSLLLWYSSRLFRTICNWWFFTEVRVIADLFRPSGFFLVF